MAVQRKLIWLIVLMMLIGVLASGLLYRTTRNPFRPSDDIVDSTLQVSNPADNDELTFGFEGKLQSNGAPIPWAPTVSSGKLDVQVESVADNSQPSKTIKVLRIRSNRSSYLLSNQQQPFDPAVYKFLSWSWKAQTLPDAGDVRQNSLLFGANRNDQALQVLVGFEGGAVLSYVWDTTAPIDTKVDEPSLIGTVKTHVIDSGTEHLNQWRQIKVNLFKDHIDRFGTRPPRVMAIVVQANSNHTASQSDGLIGPIVANKE